jgi:hypothetical protein
VSIYQQSGLPLHMKKRGSQIEFRCAMLLKIK